MLSKIFIAENFLKQEYDFTLHPSSPFITLRKRFRVYTIVL